MDSAPPPMNSDEGTQPASSLLDDDFQGADIDLSDPTSGYDSKNGEVGRSNTMDDVAGAGFGQTNVPVTLEEDDDSLFKSALIEPEPEKMAPARFDGSGEQTKEIPLEDEDESPFKDAHLKPQLQLSGSSSVMEGNTNGAVAASSVPPMDSIMEDDVDEFVDIKVTSPHKVGEGISSYMTYNIKTKTNINYFKKKEMSVNRRFSDFLGLHDKLTEKYLPNGRIIPPAPDKSVVGMTKVKMSKDNSETAGQDEFVERRRAALERFLNRTAGYSSLRTDPDFREFIELETELPKASSTATLSGKNMMKLINRVGDSLHNITLKLEETDDWFEERNHLIEQLESQLKKLHLSSEVLVDHRKSLAVNTLHLSRTLAVLSGSEDNSGLSAAISQLSVVQEKIAHIHNDQANVEFFELSELIKDYLGLVGAVKNAMAERVKAWQSWQGVSSSLTKKREAKAKAELQNKMDKVAIYRQEIAELEQQQDMAQENFDRISRLIKREVDAFDHKRVADFKKTIVRYLEVMLTAQENIASQWERYIPEIEQVSL